MKYIFMLMFLFIILAPAIYFYYRNKYRRSLIPLTLFSVIVIGVRLIIKPDFIFWKWLTLIVQFYVLFMFAYFLCSLVATGIRYFTHKELSQKLPYILITIAICLTSLGFYTHYTKEVKSYDIYINKESTMSGLKVAMLSDLHLGTGTYQEDVEKLVKTLNNKHYDVVLFCGDFFDETTPYSMIQPCLQELSNIQTTYGIYAIEGNHENYASINNEDIYENTNIHFLSNNYVCVNGLFNIIGRTDMISPSQKDMQDICKDMDISLPTIVLDHNPKRYQEAIDYCDLQLSGHTHNGQVFPGQLITNAMYDNGYGLLEKGNYHLIVTSGYGSWGFPYRLLTQCEYVEVNISFMKK